MSPPIPRPGYLLRTNVSDWSGEDLWNACIQLTEAAFRIHMSGLKIRPIRHQKEDRVLAHMLVCFPACVLWKTLAICVSGTAWVRKRSTSVNGSVVASTPAVTRNPCGCLLNNLRQAAGLSLRME